MSTLAHTHIRDDPSGSRRHRFETLFAAESRAILGYALRRVPVAEDAADVVAETFLVAWRRIGDVPSGPEGRLWLYGVARRVLANHSRGERRRNRLAERLRDDLPRTVVFTGDQSDAATIVRAAMLGLDEDDRELLQLTSWEGLTPTELATALGIPAATVRTRLHRARRRLKAELAACGWPGEDSTPGERSQPGGHVEGDGHLPVRQKEEQ